jgi:hypothetical protein
MNTYGHLFDEMQRETADKMDAVLAPPAKNLAPLDVALECQNGRQEAQLSRKLLKRMVRPE